MQLIPAIDLMDGGVVRLHQGDFSRQRVYREAPEAVALDYAQLGADWLHIVDLAASRDGAAADTSALFRLLRAAPQQVQTGGGVRGLDDVIARLEAGAQRVVVGSMCVKHTTLFGRWLTELGSEKLVAALDVQLDDDGLPWPRIHGWTEPGGRDLYSLLDALQEFGLRHLLCTDIGRDGMMAGPNVQLYAEICARYPGLQVQASGGVSRLEDLAALAGTGASAAICGKALLDGAFTVRDALGALQ